MAKDNNPAQTGLADADLLTYEQIKALSNNMYEKVQIMEDGKLRKLDPTKDTRSIYFEKSKLDALFAAHPGADGLKIFLGVHDSGVFTPRQPGYHNKLMVMLVTTTNEVENLTKPAKPAPPAAPGAPKVEKLVAALGNPGAGADNGKMCPPDSGC